MRKGFENSVRSYGESIKEKAEAKKELKNLKKQARAENRDLSDQYPDVEAIATAADKKLERVAKEQHTDKSVQERIYSLQEHKQQIMEHLKYDLACLDNPECKFEAIAGERTTEYDEIDNSFTYEDDNHKKRSATFGEVITDMDFDIYYHLDKEDVPRDEMKRYLVAKAKKELRELLDMQIMENEINSSTVSDNLKEAYRGAKNTKESERGKELPGFISEKIVKNFLRQLSMDRSLPVVVNETDVYQDVVQKMDFIIHKHDTSRGVKVESDDDRSDIAIQFSMNKDKEDLKKEQVERSKEYLEKRNEKIRDIALVVFPGIMVKELKERWEKDGKPAGGPGKYMDTKTKHQLFHELMVELFTEDEIKNLWEKATSDTGFDEDEYKMAT